MLSQLIEGLQIFLKYGDINYPTHCEHDKLTICVNPDKISVEDKKKLEHLGFLENKNEECFISFKYGSA